MRVSRLVAYGLFALATVIVVAMYARRLHDSPIYLAHDEVVFAVNAQSIASTGRDANGNWFPLYIHIGGNFWATPVNIYFSAGLFRFLPISEATIRLPSVIVGLLVVVLTYVVAERIFKSEWIAAVAAGLLALTPALFIHSRMGTDHLYPLPFILVWLCCLLAYLDGGDLRVLFAAVIFLGLGAYTYVGSLVTMPVYVVLTWITIALSGRKSLRPYAIALLGFTLPVVPLVAWFLTHPAQYAGHIAMYNLYDSASLTPLQGVRGLMSHSSLAARWNVYYGYFNPSFLFFAGDPSLINSTRYAGVFLLPIAVLLPAGAYYIVRSRPRAVSAPLLLGFLFSPLAGVVVGEPHRVNRALVMLPFAILLAAGGVEYLVAARASALRAAAVVMLCAAPVQFSSFYRDYMSAYRIRSAYWFEGNIRGAIDEIIDRDNDAATRTRSGEALTERTVYLSTTVPWIEWYWRLYLIKHAREDLLKRTVYFDPKQVNPLAMPERSLVLADVHDIPEPSLRNAGSSVRVTLVSGSNQDVEFVVLER